MNSTMYQLIKKAQTLATETGSPFEEELQKIIAEEFEQQTLQKKRIADGALTLFGNQHPDVDQMIRRGIEENQFFKEALAIFEDFYNTSLRNNNEVVIADVGVTASQPWFFYGMLHYLQAMSESSRNYEELTAGQKAMLGDLKGKKIRVALLSGRFNQEWGKVPYGDAFSGATVDEAVSNLVELYQSIQTSDDQLAEGQEVLPQPTGPSVRVDAYFTSLIMRNVIMERQTRPLWKSIALWIPMAITTFFGYLVAAFLRDLSVAMRLFGPADQVAPPPVSC